MYLSKHIEMEVLGVGEKQTDKLSLDSCHRTPPFSIPISSFLKVNLIDKGHL